MSEDEEQTAIALRRATLPEKMEPQNLPELMKVANHIAKAGLFGQRNAESAFALMLTGVELGLSPMQSLRGLYTVHGRVAMSADMMVSLVRRSSECAYFECESVDDDQCTYVTKRTNGRNEVRRSFTMAEAKRAGLGGDNWKKYPKDMLRARAASKLARQEYPGLLLGMYTADELTDGEVIEAVIVERRTAEEATSDPERVDAEFVEDEPAEPPKASEDWKRANARFWAMASAASGDVEDRERYRAGLKARLGVESLRDAEPQRIGGVLDKLDASESLLDAFEAMAATWLHDDGTPRTKAEVAALRAADAKGGQ